MHASGYFEDCIVPLKQEQSLIGELGPKEYPLLIFSDTGLHPSIQFF